MNEVAFQSAIVLTFDIDVPNIAMHFCNLASTDTASWLVGEKSLLENWEKKKKSNIEFVGFY